MSLIYVLVEIQIMKSGKFRVKSDSNGNAVLNTQIISLSFFYQLKFYLKNVFRSYLFQVVIMIIFVIMESFMSFLLDMFLFIFIGYFSILLSDFPNDLCCADK